MSGEKDSPKVPPEWREELPSGEELRKRYEDVLNEPVPEKLRQLIEMLKEKERQEKDEDGED